MKAEELRGKSVEELNKEVADLNQEMFNLKFQLHTGHLENTSRISQVRKEIARIKTVLREKRS
ncbi:MAG: 50S ribosomal protein L29 [Gammaproteobacteria bacterium]|nr:50S ribosomal protein L29 [Gammaproteobacteria bacterium]NIT06246.1 50S ribosomal protein L29 [Gammaproteobacteria bacterium]